MKWCRLYDEIIDDPKILGLSIANRWYYVGLLSVANRQTQRGSLPILKHIAAHLRLSETKARAVLDDLSEAGLIDKSNDGNTFAIHGWTKRQRESDDVGKQVSKWRKNNSVCIQNECGKDSYAGAGDRAGARSASLSVSDSDSEGGAGGNIADSRSVQDQGEFDQAIKLLSGSMQTEGVAMELSRRSDLPEIRLIEGWRWLNAARVMGKGAKAYTVEWLIGIARRTTREEFESYGKASPNGTGHRKPEPQTNMPVNAFTDPPDLAKYETEAKAIQEKYKDHPDIVELRRRRGKQIDL